LAARQPGYGVSVTLNTHGYYGVEAGILRSQARLTSNLIPAAGGDAVPESGTGDAEPGFSSTAICLLHAAWRVVSPLCNGGAWMFSFWSAPGGKRSRLGRGQLEEHRIQFSAAE